jgi:hypothetical protein
MKQLKADIEEIKDAISDIKVDLNIHIKRTNLLEKTLAPIRRAFDAIVMLICIISIVAAISGIANARIAENKKIDRTVKFLEEITGCPINIHSGYRTYSENKRVGGAKHSFHLNDMARDISSPCASLDELEALASPLVTTIKYPRHLHIDTRKDKININGKYK